MRQLIQKNTLDDTKLSSHSAQPDQMSIYGGVKSLRWCILCFGFFLRLLFICFTFIFVSSMFLFFLILQSPTPNTEHSMQIYSKMFSISHFFFLVSSVLVCKGEKGIRLFFFKYHIHHYAILFHWQYVRLTTGHFVVQVTKGLWILLLWNREKKRKKRSVKARNRNGVLPVCTHQTYVPTLLVF